MDITIEVTEIIAESTISETVITCDVVMSMESDVDKAYVDAALALKVDKLENYSLVPDTEIDKLSEYPEFEDVATKEYVNGILGDINTALETILAIEV